MKYEQNPSAWWYVLPGVVIGAGIYWYLRSGKAAADVDAAVAIEEEEEAFAAAEDKEDRRTRRKECKARTGPYKWNRTTKLCEWVPVVSRTLKTVNLTATWVGQAKAECGPDSPPMCEINKRMAVGMLKSFGLRAE